ncbi:hypothetical protein [Spirosoma oryzae]|nr:hypothetical protein [Spirosoma oryzae]
MSTTLDRIFGRATRVSVAAPEDLKELVSLFGQINRPTRMSLVQLFEKGDLAFYGQQTATQNTLQAGVWLNNRFIGVELTYDH